MLVFVLKEEIKQQKQYPHVMDLSSLHMFSFVSFPFSTEAILLQTSRLLVLQGMKGSVPRAIK